MIASIEEIAMSIINSSQGEIRDVDAGAGPFVYDSSGNRGPGYFQIKGLPGQPNLFISLIRDLAEKVLERKAQFDFVEGNATGGIVPGWELRNQLDNLLGREIPYAYLRTSEKKAGRGELITGDWNNPLINRGDSVLVVEELVNFARTTCNSALAFREAGYRVTDAACILSYDNSEGTQRLAENNIRLTWLITLPEILEVGEANRVWPKDIIDSYRSYLRNPAKWQLDRGMIIPEDSAKIAIDQGYEMVKLSADEAITAGAPPNKIGEGVVYWKNAA